MLDHLQSLYLRPQWINVACNVPYREHCNSFAYCLSIYFAHVRHLPHLLLCAPPLPHYSPNSPHSTLKQKWSVLCIVIASCTSFPPWSLLLSCHFCALTAMPRSESLHTGGISNLWQEQSVSIQPHRLRPTADLHFMSVLCICAAAVRCERCLLFLLLFFVFFSLSCLAYLRPLRLSV